MHMDSCCIILLRSYNYDTQATMIQIKKTCNVNNLILPIEFNPISYIGSNQNLLQNLHAFQPDFTHQYNQISTVGFNMISLVGSNQKRFAKSTRIST